MEDLELDNSHEETLSALETGYANYIEQYLKAIDCPPPELAETFKSELDFLISCVEDGVAVDFGCGVARPAKELASYAKQVIAVDLNPHMIEEARIRCRDIANIDLRCGDATNINVENNSADCSYATFNLMGSVDPSVRQPMLDEMARVTRPGGRVINIGWKPSGATIEFLKEYYNSIGAKVVEIDELKTITEVGTFARPSVDELLDLYKKAGLNNIHCKEIGLLWLAVVGTK